MKTERIANRQMLFILTMMRGGIAIAFLPVLTTGRALQDAWVSAIIMAPITALIAFAVASLGSKYPGLTGVQYSRKLLGSVGGTAVSLVFLYLLLHIVGTDTRVYATVLTITALPETPIEFKVATMALLTGLAAYSGIEVIGRLADILFPLFAVLAVSVLVAGIANLDLRHFEPVLARGIGPALTGVPVPIGLAAQYVVLTVLVPAINSPEKAARTAALSAILASLLVLTTAVVTIGMLGPELGSQSVYPLFIVSKNIMLGAVLQRIESLVILAWGLSLFVVVSNYTYCTSRILGDLLGLDDYRAIVGPLTALWAVYSVQAYRDQFEVSRFFTPHVVFPYTLFLLVFPVAVLWIAHLIKTYVTAREVSRR